MVYLLEGDLFEAPVDLLVWPVNTKGVMGNGIALAFRRKWPGVYEAYRKHCLEGKLKVGELFLVDHVICLPVKENFWFPSKLEWVEDGLKALACYLESEQVVSVGVPAIGQGYGKLDPVDVEALVLKYLEPLKTEVYYFARWGSTKTQKKRGA